MGNVEYSEFHDTFWISGLWTKFYIESFSSFGVHPFLPTPREIIQCIQCTLLSHKCGSHVQDPDVGSPFISEGGVIH